MVGAFFSVAVLLLRSPPNRSLALGSLSLLPGISGHSSPAGCRARGKNTRLSHKIVGFQVFRSFRILDNFPAWSCVPKDTLIIRFVVRYLWLGIYKCTGES
ncbi:hypothetical protein B0T26DRAFT_506046 [Lasiosphaeria miniovina]|uniref:Uncharacterized protein n=1 Tax=Lasiosphaeria miniovina TaxID=1954250 RepID=A0AA40DKW3_9PEZI|nr:uncharacterized protein B0T26DRAFT_506046 [Lasiosphaeria miniovina]KAK0703578.1 hypothetical protein B0T26DRAFT_506046 [Lasiosphaeria miniovina]